MTAVKRIIFTLLLCTVLTGCADDYYDEPEIRTETAEETVSETMPETGEILTEAAENCSDLIFPETTAIPEITEIQETVTVSEETELLIYEYEEEQEPEIIEIPEEAAPEPTEIIMTEEPTETELMTETETVPETIETTEIPETEPFTENESVTEPETAAEPETVPELSDFEKAQIVYEDMRENGHGTCVNHACQTYEKCLEIGLPCYIVWTDAGLYGHTANAVCVSGIWFVMDTQAGGFLEPNYGFTEVVNMDCEHIADGDMLSDYSYQELFQ